MDIFIEHLKPGQKVNGIFALRSKKLLPLRSGAGHYLAVVLGDKTGQVDGRVWKPCMRYIRAAGQGISSGYKARLKNITAKYKSTYHPCRFAGTRILIPPGSFP